MESELQTFWQIIGADNGRDAIERAYEAFQQGKITKTGLMIHYVIEAVDEGNPILTRDVEIKTGESLDDLKARIHSVEWKAIVEGTRFALDNLDTQRRLAWYLYLHTWSSRYGLPGTNGLLSNLPNICGHFPLLETEALYQQFLKATLES